MADATSQESPALLPEAHEFDFLEGEWDAVCRFPHPDGSWGEGPGTLKATKVLGGCVSMEFFEGPYQGAPSAQVVYEPIASSLVSDVARNVDRRENVELRAA